MQRQDLIPVCVAYIFTLAGAYIALEVFTYGPLLDGFLADLVGTVLIFLFGRLYHNASFYDAYWSVIPPLLAVYWACEAVSEAVDPTRQWLVIALVTYWAVRLTANWAWHWPGLSHEDWRYQPIRDKAGKCALWADFSGIHLFPTLIVFAACLPIYAAVSLGDAPLNWLDYVAAVVTFGAITLEMIADLQLHRFAKNKQTGDIINTGVWQYSRHPNYLGEFGFWLGLMLFGLAAYPQGWWWIIPGALAMLAMFVYVSIPLMDERSCARRKNYAAHMEAVPALFPHLFPKK